MVAKFKKISFQQILQLLEVYDPYAQIIEKNKALSEVFKAIKKLEWGYQLIKLEDKQQFWGLV